MSFMLGNIRGPRRSQMIAQQKKKILAEQERTKKMEEMIIDKGKIGFEIPTSIYSPI